METWLDIAFKVLDQYGKPPEHPPIESLAYVQACALVSIAASLERIAKAQS